MMKDYWSLAESRNRDAIVSLYVIHFFQGFRTYSLLYLTEILLCLMNVQTLALWI